MPNISVNNFDVVKKHLRDELSILSTKLDKTLKSAKTENDQLKLGTIRELMGLIQLFTDSFEKIGYNPTINISVPDVMVPEIKVPEVHIPPFPEQKQPIVNVPAPIVNFKTEDIKIDLSKFNEAIEPLYGLVESIESIVQALNNIPTNNDSLIESLAKEANRNISNMSAVFSGGRDSMTVDNPVNNPVNVKPVKTTSSNVTSVAGSASSVSLLAANTDRKGFIIYNDSTAILYIKLGATASTSSFTYRLTPNGIVTAEAFGYTGVIDGIWASAAGNSRITELS